ncbi:UDP-N-acetyl-D-mannosamine dehydrogenase [Psychrobacter sp. P11G3]|uniref:UDP-N-acetyl-D-mannosamine dehydrogenase n=1 Tax=Psychrobacter sp. P11G3 TaxID=1699623 RepID=UPI00070ADD53|nr:UDP-N-acetyl-D-mannosamine dehydrogenase [Psychrobacter sp. P11G3]KRG35756.1 UDP-N-acetyl-D-mannosaminuronic acid dehydrogenase [Psychrobacter sp. P11G3]
MKNICVFGLGYIGLPTAAMFAHHGANVIGVDVNQHAVDTINQGKIHIVEPGLEAIVKQAVDKGNLKASLTPVHSDAYLIAVPTPFKGQDHEPDLSYIQAVSKALAPLLQKGDVVILESTSPVGATEKMVEWLAEERADLSFPKYHEPDNEADIFVAYCPERVLPGKVVEELISNDRIIGGMTKESTRKAQEVYRIFVEGDLLATNSRTAEMAKLTENASRDVSIAFANELSIISDKLDINVWELIELANHHPRVNILQPGAGVGGHCIAVDPWFIVNQNPDEAKIIRAAREINDNKPNWVISKINAEIDTLKSENMARPKVALLGLAFKPNIDDLRESPAVSIAKNMLELNSAEVLLVEPNIKQLPEKLATGNLVSLESALEQADILVVLVAHDEFEKNQLSSNARLINVVSDI